MGDHVNVRAIDGSVCVVVDDYELMGFVDDFLTEQHGMQVDRVDEAVVKGKAMHTLHLCGPVTSDSVLLCLEGLNPDEVERIWRLNNQGRAATA